MNLKTFLIVTVDGGGNLPPVFGLADRLQKRGHRIVVLTEPCLQEVVERRGYSFIPFQQHFTRTDRKEPLIRDWNTTPASDPTMEEVVLGPAPVVVAETRAAIQRKKVDVLLVDLLLPPAVLAAEAEQIPSAILWHMPEYLPGSNRPPGMMGLLPGRGMLGRLRDRMLGAFFYRMTNTFTPTLNEICTELGVEPLKNAFDLLHRADRRLLMTMRDFDFPLVPAPENVRYTGPVLDDPDWVEPWESPWAELDERPLVVVSFSSTFQDQMSVIRRCIVALGTLDVRALITLGPAVDLEQAYIPANIHVVRSAPHSRIFPQADLVITHAGHGTIMRALSHGLPLLCLPKGRDQNDNAAKVNYYGYGLKINRKASAKRIGKSVQRLLTDPGFRQKAEATQAGIQQAVNQDMALREIEVLAEASVARFLR